MSNAVRFHTCSVRNEEANETLRFTVPKRYTNVLFISAGAQGTVVWVFCLFFKQFNYLKKIIIPIIDCVGLNEIGQSIFEVENVCGFQYSSAWDSLTNTKVAIKKMQQPFLRLKKALRAFREIVFLSSLDHPNVSNFLPISDIICKNR